MALPAPSPAESTSTYTSAIGNIPGNYPAGLYTPMSEDGNANQLRPDSRLDSVQEDDRSSGLNSPELSTKEQQTTPSLEKAQEEALARAGKGDKNGSFFPSIIAYPASFKESRPTSALESDASSHYSSDTARPGDRKDYTSADTKFPLLFPTPLMEQPAVKPIHVEPADDVPADVLANRDSDVYSSDEQRDMKASTTSVATDHTARPQPPRVFAMNEFSDQKPSSDTHYKDGLAETDHGAVVYSGIEVPPLRETERDPLEEGTMAGDDLSRQATPAAAPIRNNFFPADKQQPLDNDEKQNARPDAVRLNTLQRKEIEMIPVATVPISAAAYDQALQPPRPATGQSQSGKNSFVHPWDRQNPSHPYYTGEGAPASQSQTGVPVGGIMPYDQSQNVRQSQVPADYMYQPQPVYPNQPHFVQMDRAASSRSARPASIADSKRRANIFESMSGVPDPTYDFQRSETPGARRSSVARSTRSHVTVEDGNKTPVPEDRAKTPAHFYEHLNPSSGVDRNKSTKSFKSARSRDGPVAKDAPARLHRRHTLPSNPLWGSSSSGRKSKGFLSWLPDNPLWTSSRKHHRLPQSPFVGDASRRSSRRYSSEQAPSRRYSTVSRSASRRSIIPDSPWMSSGGSKRRPTSKLSQEYVPPHRRRESILSRRSTLRSQRASAVPSAAIEEDHSESKSTAGVRSRPQSVLQTTRSRPQSVVETRSRPQSVVDEQKTELPDSPTSRGQHLSSYHRPQIFAQNETDSQDLNVGHRGKGGLYETNPEAIRSSNTLPASSEREREALDERPRSILKSSPSRNRTPAQFESNNYEEAETNYSYSGEQGKVPRIIRGESGYNPGF